MKGIFILNLILCFTSCLFCSNIASSRSLDFKEITSPVHRFSDTLYFVNPPSDVTISCNEVMNTGLPLQVVNSNLACQGITNVLPVSSGTYSLCGGTKTYVWTHTDMCGKTISHTQNIYVGPSSPASFTSFPPDVTINYNDVPTMGPTLIAKNNNMGSCAIEQEILPIQSGAASICGGEIQYLWTFTDMCQRTITHRQILTCLPTPKAEFVNPPADITIDCSLYPLINTQSLELKNNEIGIGAISAFVTPTVVDSVDNCNGFVDLIYTYADTCNRVNIHKQRITINSTNSSEDEIGRDEIVIYPNPVNDFLYIKSNKNSFIEISDVYGNPILTSKENIIDLRDLNSGVYFLKIDGMGLKKILKL
jgi:hypothetical protein